MAAPVFAALGTSSGGATAATVAVPVPAGVAAGHVVLVMLYKDGTAAVTVPSGFTEITPAPSTTATGSVFTHHLFWKRATGADSGSYTFSWTGSVFRAGIALRYTGCVTTGSPVDVAASAVSDVLQSATAPVSATTTGADRLLVWAGANNTGDTWTVPTGFAQRYTVGSVHTIADKTQATAGATGSVTGSCATADVSTARLVALLPVPPTAVSAAVTAGVAASATANTPAAVSATVTVAASATAIVPVLATATAPLGGLTASATSRRTVFGAGVAGVLNAADYPSDGDPDYPSDTDYPSETSYPSAGDEPSDTDYPGDGGDLGGLTAQATALYRAGTAIAALGSLTATATGLRNRPGTATAPLGALTGTAAGLVYHQGGTALLGALTATATGTRTRYGTAAAALGVVSSTATSYRARPGTAAAALGGLSGTATTAAPSPASSFFFASV